MLNELIFGRALLMVESVNSSKVIDALKNHRVIQVSYRTKGGDRATKPREIEVYGYGTTKAGFEVIRTFQREGDTTTRVPHWKFMRLDRIQFWRDTGKTFDSPPEERFSGIPPFNPNGDDTMSAVFMLSDINNKKVEPSQEEDNALNNTNKVSKKRGFGKPNVR